MDGPENQNVGWNRRIALCGGDSMKLPALTVTENRPHAVSPPEEAIRKAVAAWLAKALRQ